MNNTIVGTLIEAGIRTASGNGQDFVENTIDVVFEPLETIGSFIDNIFGW